jgi:hypothetical protein
MGHLTDNTRALHDETFPVIQQAANGHPGISTTGFAGIYWPSLRFPPTQAPLPRNYHHLVQERGVALAQLAWQGDLSTGITNSRIS